MANVLHAMVAMSTIADWIHHVIYTHQLKHRECFRITDDRPLARIAADRESIMVLGKPASAGFFSPVENFGAALNQSRSCRRLRFFDVGF
ncbi:hypothetical protein C0J26_25330 [Pseudomonas baetica]|nr:hypothetical protein C0J26_25330 [Pseudomonas baetica]